MEGRRGESEIGSTREKTHLKTDGEANEIDTGMENSGSWGFGG